MPPLSIGAFAERTLVAVIGCGGVGCATHTLNGRNTDVVEAIRQVAGGFGADVVIEAIGLPETYEQAFYARDRAGTLSWYGDCLPSPDFPMLIDLYLQGRLPLDVFVSDRVGLDEVENAFTRMQRGEVLRSVVVF